MLARIDPADGGPRSLAAVPERLCVATRVVKPVGEMIRFVVAPDGAVVADLKRKLPGRGVWVTATREALTEAVRRKAFGRGFKREVRTEADLPDRVDAMLAWAALDALAIAYKSGAVVTGFAKVEAALQRKKVTGLVHAADAAADGVKKLAGAAKQQPRPIPVVALFDSAQLGLALGRANVIHAALLADRAADSFLARCRSLERFRTGSPEGRHGAA